MSNYPNIEHPNMGKSRIGGLSSTYFDIAQREYSKYIDFDSALSCESDEMIQHELERKSFECGLKSILFSALCVEAGINDYAAWQLGDNYFNSHFSNMDVVSKWVVVPNLVTGRSLDKSKAAYQALVRLIKSRNSLVHNKSKHLDLGNPKLGEILGNRIEEFRGDIENSYKTLLFLSFEFDTLLGPAFNPIGTLDSDLNVTLDLPENLKAMFHKCKNIVRESAS